MLSGGKIGTILIASTFTSAIYVAIEHYSIAMLRWLTILMYSPLHAFQLLAPGQFAWPMLYAVLKHPLRGILKYSTESMDSPLFGLRGG